MSITTIDSSARRVVLTLKRDRLAVQVGGRLKISTNRSSTVMQMTSPAQEKTHPPTLSSTTDAWWHYLLGLMLVGSICLLATIAIRVS